ncbi:hypothetical protein PI124_g19532 [Phytophthora idaei]|nr:hypothetical protein PI125_g20579 [Phytophthora idaei]KAG3134189.1 hypothetical protein PI126_g18812 [Phytophthora idaei]KAG3235436.1 hypothetical protein PI124_g19532 [Phytophthora idaei]
MVAPGGKTPRNKLTAEQQKLCLDALRRERRTRRARGNDAQEAKTTDQGTEVEASKRAAGKKAAVANKKEARKQAEAAVAKPA